MSKSTCEPDRCESIIKDAVVPKREEICENCYFWDKDTPHTTIYEYPGFDNKVEIHEGIHPCNRMPGTLLKYLTQWCGEWKLEIKTIEEPLKITDKTEDYNGTIHRGQGCREMSEVLGRRVHKPL